MPRIDRKLIDLAEKVQRCQKCPALCDQRKILSAANGHSSARIMFIAEAPGRLGADRTGIPLHGDASGNNFEELLAGIGWERKQVFITNTVLCNPLDEAGRNRKPSYLEITNCLEHLRAQIDLVDPAVIVTFGAVALNTIYAIHPHKLNLRESAGIPVKYGLRILLPLYHTSPRVFVFRTKDQQRQDWLSLKNLINPLTGEINNDIVISGDNVQNHK